jgi:protein O-GlcNAc transferase
MRERISACRLRCHSGADVTAEPLYGRLTAALAHHQRGQLAAARASYSAILKDHPRCFDALHLLGILNADTGDVDQGIVLIRSALAVDSSRSQAHYSLATALVKKGQVEPALSSLDRALALQPDLAEAWFVRGNVLQQAERLEESVESYRRAVDLRPAFPEAFNNLAAAERALRRVASAHQSADRALALRPDYAKALNNRGLILLDGRRTAAAVEDFRRAVDIDQNFAEAWHNLGTALLQLRRFAEARDVFARLAVVAPGFRHVQGNLLFAKLSCCDWTGFDAAVEGVRQAVDRGEHATLPAAFLAICGSAASQLRCAALYSDAYFPPRTPPAFDRARSHDRIRVAYLSGDLGEHAITYLLAGVFERHDSSRFETTAISWDRRGTSGARRRVESAFTRFIDVTDSGDAEVAKLMRDLEVDIAVDLMGHTLGQRTGILARRPAPVQVNYLGLPATMGAPYIDYLIVDRYLVPEDQSMHYAERLILLPGCFQPNDDARTLPIEIKPRGAYGLPADALVFCCFNRNNKFVPSCFDVWMRLLGRVPGSVLWLLATDLTAADNLRHEAARRGIDAARLIFAGEEPYDAYLARYPHADLLLDTVPFNGGTTVSDAVSMGIPVLTCAGESFASRMAGSILCALGLPELVTHSLDEYSERALELAIDRARLAELRRSLLQRRGSRGFFDTDRYRLGLESAYAAMWERYTAGLAPADITIPAQPT